MKNLFTRRSMISTATATVLAVTGLTATTASAAELVLRMSTPASATDQRSVGLETIFGPAVAGFADYQPSYSPVYYEPSWAHTTLWEWCI